MLILRKPWTVQPQTVQKVSQAHPLAGKLLIVSFSRFVFNRSSLVLPLSIGAGSPVISTGRLGQGPTFAGGASQFTFAHPTLTSSENFTLEVLCSVTTVPSLAGFYGIGEFGGVNGSARGIIAFSGGSNRNIYFWGRNADLASGVDWRTDGSIQHVFITRQGASMVFYRDGVQIASGTTPTLAAANSGIGYFGDTNTTFASSPTGTIFKAATYNAALTAGEIAELTQNPWQVFEPHRIIIPVSAGAGGGFTSTGALSATAATLAGTASHLTLHNSTGSLISNSATLAGVANSPHLSTGVLAAGAATIAGSASHLTLHSSTGALVAADATLSGSANLGTGFSATGSLSAQAAAVVGAATRFALHSSTGSLTAQAAVVAGTAARLALHTSAGALSAQAAVLAGSATHTGSGSGIYVYMWQRTA